MAVLPPFPNFLIIGVERNATRWLRFNLNEHPDICAPPLQLDFFSDFPLMARKGLRWYREQFEEWNGEPFLGECSPSYLLWLNQPERVAERIQKLMPDVRLLAIVGNPVDRLQSALRHHRRWGRIGEDVTCANFVDLGIERIGELNLFAGYTQCASLESYRALFGDQLAVLFLDDVIADPEQVYRDALAHIGASTDFVGPRLHERLYSDRFAVELPEPNAEERELLFEWCRRDVEKLEVFTGRDLSSWRPASAPVPDRDEAS